MADSNASTKLRLQSSLGWIRMPKSPRWRRLRASAEDCKGSLNNHQSSRAVPCAQSSRKPERPLKLNVYRNHFVIQNGRYRNCEHGAGEFEGNASISNKQTYMIDTSAAGQSKFQGLCPNR